MIKLYPDAILNETNALLAKKHFYKAVDIGIKFKLSSNVNSKKLKKNSIDKIIKKIPKEGKDLEQVLSEFQRNLLPYCSNFSSSKFMGFPDCGNSNAAILGSILYNFLQQNLINQSFCAPSATFAEIAVLQWLREVVGYKNKKIIKIWDVGGLITPGGTMSNTIGILLARENKFPGTLEKGVQNSEKGYLIVPKGIGHYSVKSSQMWVGMGNRLIEVETNNFRMDLKDFERKLKKHREKIMCVVAYAGDSRTMSVDNFEEIYKIAKSIDKNIWLHADACHGFSLGFSRKLKKKIKGMEKFDSITMDPHKVMLTPYVISALLVKNQNSLKKIISLSDLIMQEDFAFGQITPFLGSRSWESLKLWFVINHLGKNGLGKIIENRYDLAVKFANLLEKDDDFIVLNKVDINSVMFMYKKNIRLDNIRKLNSVNKKIHSKILSEGKFYIHKFSIPDSGILKKNEIIYPLRFMSGNPNTKECDLVDLIKYIKLIGGRITKYG